MAGLGLGPAGPGTPIEPEKPEENPAVPDPLMSLIFQYANTKVEGANPPDFIKRAVTRSNSVQESEIRENLRNLTAAIRELSPDLGGKSLNVIMDLENMIQPIRLETGEFVFPPIFETLLIERINNNLQEVEKIFQSLIEEKVQVEQKGGPDLNEIIPIFNAVSHVLFDDVKSKILGKMIKQLRGVDKEKVGNGIVDERLRSMYFYHYAKAPALKDEERIRRTNLITDPIIKSQFLADRAEKYLMDKMHEGSNVFDRAANNVLMQDLFHNFIDAVQFIPMEGVKDNLLKRGYEIFRNNFKYDLAERILSLVKDPLIKAELQVDFVTLFGIYEIPIEKALEITSLIIDPRAKATALEKISHSYMSPVADENFERIKTLLSSISDRKLKVKTQENLARIHIHWRDYQKAINIIKDMIPSKQKNNAVISLFHQANINRKNDGKEIEDSMLKAMYSIVNLDEYDLKDRLNLLHEIANCLLPAWHVGDDPKGELAKSKAAHIENEGLRNEVIREIDWKSQFR